MSTDKTELRGLVPAALAQALDAIAMDKGMDRNSYVTLVLEAEVKKVGHEAMVIARVLRGNPLVQECDGSQSEPRSRFHG